MVFQVIAFLLLAVFYGCYLGKLIGQKKKNIQTDLLGKGKKGTAQRVELLLKGITYAVLIAEIFSIAGNRSFGPLWLRVVGAVTGACGVAVFILSVLEMRDSWRAGVPEKAETELVTTGIYRYSRNPAFLGFDLTYLGILAMFWNGALLVLTAITVGMLHLQIVKVEEPFMHKAFGKPYLDYQSMVARYLGRKA